MKNSAIILILLSVQMADLKGQKIQYGGMQQLSLTINENNTSALFSVVNGVRFHRFFAGLGADAQLGGYSYYYPNRQSAFFADTRYYINEKKNFFVKGAGGVNILHKNPYTDFRYTSKRRAGYYAAAGVGFKARLGKEVFYSFDIGYSWRQSRFETSMAGPGLTRPWDDVKYDLRRSAIVVNMGLEIF
jgi:hypothetical protein